MKTTDSPPQISALVIDDEPQIQRLLTIMLESQGYRVGTAASGKEGLATSASDGTT